MLRPRVIPCLLLQDGGLVKTVRFKDAKYVGDPVNAIKIFNEKLVDELMVVDIDATVEGRGPDLKLIRDFAVECRMPLTYGGGVTSVAQVQDIVGLGVEKVALSHTAIENPGLLTEMASAVGSQSVVAVLDVKPGGLMGGRYDIYTHNGTRRVKVDLFDMIATLQDAGIGELVINTIHLDGEMKGYDLKLATKVMEHLRVPVTFLGGAGRLEDISALVEACGTVGCAAGSLFVFKGRYRAVLINYPDPGTKEALFGALATPG